MLMLKKRNFIFLIVVSVLIGALVSGSAVYLSMNVAQGNSVVVSQKEYDTMKALSTKYSKLEGLWQYVSKKYYIPVEDQSLEQGVYKGLLWGLKDPYSSYLTAKEYDQMMINTTGEYEGIGVTIAAGEDGYVTVVAPMDGSPAYEAGLKSGDKIVMIDGQNYDNATLDEAAVALRGKSGTTVKVTVARDGKPLNFSVIRSKITLETVTSKVLANNIGYIRISSFEENTATDFTRELRAMEVKQVKGLIIDLRDNGGGLVHTGTEIADLLLPSGLIAYTEDREGNRNDFKSDTSATKLPYVVLINEGTASTSEIVAAAIKDHQSGTLVGTTTFGKGIIQTLEQLETGDAIKLTIMQYFSPKGNVIHKKGVEPDVVVEAINDDDKPEQDVQLEKALEIIKK